MLNFDNLAMVDAEYKKFLENPGSVDSTWRHFFEGWEMAFSMGGEGVGVDHLIEAYRFYGHLSAAVNPLSKPKEAPELKLSRFGLSGMVPTNGFLKEAQVPLATLVQALKETYCGPIGFEYMGLRNPELEQWLQEKIEPGCLLPFANDDQMAILHDLTRAELFETFLHTRYVGQKRFSLEGAETVIPMLSFIIEKASGEGVKEVVLGMSHRGRLNVLANIMSKSYEAIFHEFEDHYTPDLFEGTGDVKYHRGFAGHLTTRRGQNIHITLSANPSHLESVDPVVEGQARAKQEIHGKKEILPILIHGDASVSGQGVVYETMQLGRLNGYSTGGTLHIVINNQIGFTTLPKDGRSTTYCSDIALAFGAPVLHVNAEKPEHAVYAALLALEIRQKFHCDVFLDLYCYRKYGHNETDEPAFTQPREYQLIRSKPSIRQIYRKEKMIPEAVAQKMEDELKASLAKAIEKVEVVAPKLAQKEETFPAIDTKVAAEILIKLADDFCHIPEGLHLHPKVEKLLKERLAQMHTGIDWGMAEHLAYASLLAEGIHIRISGQDVRRGTFSHRHAMWVDQELDKRYYPLSHLKEGKAPFDVFNSPLSEFAVMAFDYGYSLSYPKSLVIWEAQFGDFVNGAQIVIDQYLSSAEQKWGLHSGLTLFLPHGYEGQGPEHSSGRMERFLQLSAFDNWQVVNATTPAQLFHVLRRQGMRSPKKPLIIFTPKMLLRHPQCISPLSAFAAEGFEEILDDPKNLKNVTRILFCTGKIYYMLAEARKRDDTAIIRIEQLYPFNSTKLLKLLEKYPACRHYSWVQEEPENMGAFGYIKPKLEELLQTKLAYIGRAPSASTAVGSYELHSVENQTILKKAFNES